MAKLDKWERAHLRNDVALGKRIDSLYDKLIQEASRMGVTIETLDDATFAFDNYPALKQRVAALLQEYHDGMEAIIVNGIRSQWTLANNKNNELARQVFGDKVGKLSEEQYKRYFSTNPAALDAFIKRKTAGLNLSDRVWKYTDQFKEEIELGLDLGIRSGKSAVEMTQDVKQYLRYPDKLFRRVRDEHGILQLSKAAQEFHPGTGVYRSSYKNARRLTSTETNIAYRTADHLRMQDADYIVGIKICLSNNHPEVDICNDLQGNYPKDFKFVGWHPHCRCHVETILKTQQEMEKDTERILAGERPNNESINKVTETPQGFKTWVKLNKGRIESAAKRGKLPYFIKDNEGTVDSILNPSKQAIKIAQQRHEARTLKQIEAIQKEWDARKEIIATGNATLKELQGIPDINTTQLADNLRRGRYHSAKYEINYFQAKLDELHSLTYIEDGVGLARKYGFSDIMKCEKAINITFARWRWDDDMTSLKFLKGKLETEIQIVEQRKKYTTWKIAQDAFKKRLDIINYKIERTELADNISSALSFAKSSKSKSFKTLLSEWDGLVKADAPISELKKTATKLENKYKAEITKNAKLKSTTGDIKTDVENFIKSKLGYKYNLTDKDLVITSNGVKLSENGYSALSEYHMATLEERKWAGKYVRTSNSFKINGKLDDVGGGGVNYSTKSHINPLGRDLYGSVMTAEDIKDIKNFDKVIDARTIPFDIDIVRMITTEGLAGQFRQTGKTGQALADALNAMVGDEVIAHRYLSFSTDINKNVFDSRNVIWHTKIKKGTHGYFADNPWESELVLGREIKITINKVNFNSHNKTFEIWVDVVE